MDEQRLFTAAELATALGASESAINLWTKNKIIVPLRRDGRRARLYTQSELAKARAYQSRSVASTRLEMPVNPQRLTGALTARYLGVSQMMVCRWVAAKKMPYHMDGDRPFFRRAELDEWLKGQGVLEMVDRARMSLAAAMSPDRLKGEPLSAAGLRAGAAMRDSASADAVRRMDMWTQAASADEAPKIKSSAPETEPPKGDSGGPVEAEADEW